MTINGKEYYTWDDMCEILRYMQEHGIIIEKTDNGVQINRNKGEIKE